MRAGADSVGVELLGEAVRLSGLTEDETIFRGKVSERIPQLQERVKSWRSKNREGSVVIFANPPRTGLEDEVIEWISASEIKPEKVAYLSCSAGTLARDLSKLEPSKLEPSKLANLENSKYRVRRIIPYDFFPQTHHVETLACLELDSF
jgi:tRNA/tmRNA/rRNA uracil-C5-methylase (TrmA/RlmC/RlmD family)